MWYINNKVYDLSGFKHPGGPVALEVAKNRDATEMFKSYHPFSPHVEQVLSKYEVRDKSEQLGAAANIGSTESTSLFEWNEESLFMADLINQVKPLLKGANYATTERWMQIVVILLVNLALLVPFVRGNYLALVVFPVALWLLTVNVFHDASHFAMTKDWRINSLLCYLFPWFSSPFTWYHQHVIGHHSYTNLHEDPDLHHGSYLFRYHPEREHKFWFRFQVYYLVFLWSIVVASLAFVFDIELMLRESYHNIVKSMQISTSRKVAHYMGRLIAFSMIFVWPYFMPHFSWTQSVIWSLLPHIIFSICFSFCTQIGHLTSETVNERSSDWYTHQVSVSHSFAPESFLWFIFTGGLNLQTEHHLFPGVNSWNLRRIQPIVQACCKKHGVKYNLSATGYEAFMKHINLLQLMAVNSK